MEPCSGSKVEAKNNPKESFPNPLTLTERGVIISLVAQPECWTAETAGKHPEKYFPNPLTKGARF